MSQMIDFTVPSTVPGRTLHAFRCVPEGEVKAVLQLSHGMVDYVKRYSNDWDVINYDGQEAYVSSRFLEKVEPVAETEVPATSGSGQNN